MRLLFVHHHFPGQFVHVVHALAQTGAHEIVFVSRPTAIKIGGVHQVSYAVTPASGRTHPYAREFDAAMRRAQAVAEVATGLRAAGFQPDLVIGHEGWGETLNLGDIWPAAPQIGYREYFYHESGADVGFDPEFPVNPIQIPAVRAKNAVGMLALLQRRQGVSPTAWQRSLYPDWAHPSIAVVPDGVNLHDFSPDPTARSLPFRLGRIRIDPDHTLLTFAARDLEPYRGFHTLVRALPKLMTRRDLQIICLGGDGVSYGVRPPLGTWRERLMAEVSGQVDLDRLHFPGPVGHRDFRDALRRSDIHAYLSYPFIASWSLREALACGCVIVAADTTPVREFIADGVNGKMVPALDPSALADQALDLLARPDHRRTLGMAARAWAERNLAMARHLAGWAALIEQVGGVVPEGMAGPAASRGGPAHPTV